MNEMKNSCQHNQDDITLLFYGELNEAQQESVEARLVLCDSCKHTYNSLVALAECVPTKPLLELDDASLDAIRTVTLRKLNQLAAPEPSSYSLIPGWKRSTQWGLVAALVLVSFWVGGLRLQTPSLTSAPALEHFENVSDIEFDEQNGQVQINFEKLSESSIKGDVNDRTVQSLLSTALMNRENPASRLVAARILAMATFTGAQPDPTLVGALETVLVTETNQGIRLQAVKALRSLAAVTPLGIASFGEDLKASLVDILLNDPNSAVRIEVMELLTQSEVTSLDMRALFEQAQSDSNPLIRRKAGLFLEELEPAGRLEEIR